MKEFDHIVRDLLGVHARPAQKLIDLVKKFDSEVSINFNGREVDIKELDEFVGLGIDHGDEIKIIVDGEDENILTPALKEAFKEYL